ncbi:hypothetical protein VB636_16430, partial [Paracoccus sp. APAP_BH8]|uniref:hypothetical protein n=1 Tax=Paracoccus sp. APAP_BH8 TaxID=3110237 RepID=UPI002FD7FF58
AIALGLADLLAVLIQEQLIGEMLVVLDEIEIRADTTARRFEATPGAVTLIDVKPGGPRKPPGLPPSGTPARSPINAARLSNSIIWPS